MEAQRHTRKVRATIGSIRDSQRKIGGFGAGKEIEKQSIQTVSCAGEWGQAIPQEGGTTDEDSA
jgi:hypothetical protein